MGFVFQQPTLMKNLNIFDNIILPSLRDNKKNAVKIKEKAKFLMKKMGIRGIGKARYYTCFWRAAAKGRNMPGSYE